VDFNERIYGSKISFGILIVLIIWLIGSLFYYEVEKFSIVDSFYFAATTLTTVGFGDLHPRTTLGKMFTVAYVFMGLGVVLFVLTQFGRYYVEAQFEDMQRHRRRLKRKKK